MQSKTKKLTVIAMFSALAFLVMVVGRVPIVLFLKYDPKDVVLTIGGFLYGPVASMAMSVIVSLVEMVTVSENGFIGLVMNIMSSCSFACTAAFIYKKRHTMAGAVIGLIAGCLAMIAVMLLWNYCITPIHMDRPRAEVAGMLIPFFLPFNALKSGLNAAFTMLLYKPVSTALRKANLMPANENTRTVKGRVTVGSVLGSLFVIATCVLCILVWQGKL